MSTEVDLQILEEECRKIIREGFASLMTEFSNSLECYFNDERVNGIVGSAMDRYLGGDGEGNDENRQNENTAVHDGAAIGFENEAGFPKEQCITTSGGKEIMKSTTAAASQPRSAPGKVDSKIEKSSPSTSQATRYSSSPSSKPPSAVGKTNVCIPPNIRESASPINLQKTEDRKSTPQPSQTGPSSISKVASNKPDDDKSRPAASQRGSPSKQNQNQQRRTPPPPQNQPRNSNKVNRQQPPHRVSKNRRPAGRAGPQPHGDATKKMVEDEWGHDGDDDKRARVKTFLETHEKVDYFQPNKK